MNLDDILPAGFRVDMNFTEFEVVLGISGDLNVHSAPELDAIFESIFDRGHDSVVLDLSGVGFMDRHGLKVITDAARHLRSFGAVLALRSPSAEIRRILNSSGLAEIVQPEIAGTDGSQLGPEQTIVAHHARVRSTPEAAPAIATSTERELLDSALNLVVNLARMSVGGADGVSVSLLREGQIETVAASDQTILQMDAGQYATREGPCLDASVEGRWFHVNSLDKETRWPAFIPMAQALGISAILSNPLRASGRPVGALNIYSRAVAAFGPREQALAAAFAIETSAILSHAGLGTSDAIRARRVHNALRSREVIAQAQGIMMERESVNENAAFDNLRRISQQTSRPLRERAEDVVASTQWSKSKGEQIAGIDE